MSTLGGAARALLTGSAAFLLLLPAAHAAETAPAAAGGPRPNLEGQLAQTMRYRPDGEDFVIDNGGEFFNRSLYGGTTAFRVDGGDKPEFVLYLPGRGGNLRLGVRTAGGSKWLHEAASIVTRYRPGELHYEIRDPVLGPAGALRIAALAYTATEGLIVRAEAHGLPADAELIWAYGGVNGQRGKRDGDIGTEQVPISQWFQLQPGFARGNRIALAASGFTLTSKAASILGVVPQGAQQQVADAAHWNNLAALLTTPADAADTPLALGRAALRQDTPLLLSLQRINESTPAPDLDTYAKVTAGASNQAARRATPLAAPYTSAQLPALFTQTQAHFAALRHKVVIDTPDPYLNAASGALNVVGDALWDDSAQAIMHGSIAWRVKLLGWRGPYLLDALGWHERARQNQQAWTGRQNTSAIPDRLPGADAGANLARNEPGLHSNGDLSNSHYDMNLVFMDALFRHLQWTGDLAYAREVWPVIERHLAWEQRLFRRQYGPDQLPLYEAYAAIWASDDLYYSGGGTTHASAYNYYAHRSAARIARLIGKNGDAYEREAELIAQAMRAYLWMPERGAFGEYRDLLGGQRLHPSYGLWSFYHTIDAALPTRQEAWRMADDLQRHLKPIPVHGPGVPSSPPLQMLPTSDWMPYSWSINNVVMGENLHTALALWQAGRAEDAYVLTRSSLMASMYMGIAPGNVGSMNYLDVYRRESQRDFADGAGVMARALIEGLFGVQADALARQLTVRPGFPVQWERASLQHPDLGLRFTRSGKVERWILTQPEARFGKFTLVVPASYNRVASVTVNGNPATWRADPDAIGKPMLLIEAAMGSHNEVAIIWDGTVIDSATKVAATGFAPQRSGDFTWLAAPAAMPASAAAASAIDMSAARPNATFTRVDLAPLFNDSVSAIFKPGKYLAPRSPHVSLAMPSQGIGAWAGHVNDMANIDDSGLRQTAARQGGVITLPNGVPFATPGGAQQANIAFTSLWRNYPEQTSVALCGKASGAWLLMAGSTNFMQSRIDNGEIVVNYVDGSSDRLALINPSNWWPIEEDYVIDDYQFRRPGPAPVRIDLKTGNVRMGGSGQPGKRIDGGSATVLHLALNPAKALRSLSLRTLSNDVVIGLMGLTLEDRTKEGCSGH